MGIRQKGSVRGEMRGARGGLGSGSLVKGEKKERLNEEREGGKKRQMGKMRCRREETAKCKQLDLLHSKQGLRRKEYD